MGSRDACYEVMSVSDYDTFTLVGVALVDCDNLNVQDAFRIFTVILEKDTNGTYTNGAAEGDYEYTEAIARTNLDLRVKFILDPATELLLTGSMTCSDYWCMSGDNYMGPDDIVVPPGLTMPMWFPWSQDSLMVYSVLGLHNPGFGIAPDEGGAVDFLSDGDIGSLHAPNMMYTAMAGDVVNVCHDGLQTAIYLKSEEAYIVQAHLQYDPRINIGQEWDVGMTLGPMITGAHPDARCGYTDQLDNHFHVHYAFKWQSNHVLGFEKAFRTEDWYISEDGIWQSLHGVAPDIGVGDWMTATWSMTPKYVDPFSGEFDTMYDYILDGVVSITEKTAEGLPVHNPMGIAKVVGGVAGIAINIVFMMLLTNFDMRLFIACVGVILFIKMVQFIYSAISTFTGIVGKALLGFFL
jgi:hypothetical protein